MGAKGMSDLLAQWDWSEPPDPTHWQWLSQVAEREPWAIEHGLLAAKCVALLARALTLPDETVKALSLAGLLHDVGKVALPPAFLRSKTAPLSGNEFARLREHPEVGARIAQSLGLPEMVVTAIWHHHERWDGKGYPFGKAGTDIPLEGRIVALGELTSSLLTPRHYRSALSPAQAIARLEGMAGKQLDGELVRAFLPRFPQLFGFYALSALRERHQPASIEALTFGEEMQVWRATTMFFRQLLRDAERLFGKGFCYSLSSHLDHWFALHDIPLQVQGLRLKSTGAWWQSLSDLVRSCRLLFSLIVNALGYLLGATFVTDWLENLRRSLPEPLDAIGIRYGLWVWHEPPAEAEVMVRVR